jgi:hypothetical protein
MLKIILLLTKITLSLSFDNITEFIKQKEYSQEEYITYNTDCILESANMFNQYYPDILFPYKENYIYDNFDYTEGVFDSTLDFSSIIVGSVSFQDFMIKYETIIKNNVSPTNTTILIMIVKPILKITKIKNHKNIYNAVAKFINELGDWFNTRELPLLEYQVDNYKYIKFFIDFDKLGYLEKNSSLSKRAEDEKSIVKEKLEEIYKDSIKNTVIFTGLVVAKLSLRQIASLISKGRPNTWSRLTARNLIIMRSSQVQLSKLNVLKTITPKSDVLESVSKNLGNIMNANAPEMLKLVSDVTKNTIPFKGSSQILNFFQDSISIMSSDQDKVNNAIQRVILVDIYNTGVEDKDKMTPSEISFFTNNDISQYINDNKFAEGLSNALNDPILGGENKENFKNIIKNKNNRAIKSKLLKLLKMKDTKTYDEARKDQLDNEIYSVLSETAQENDIDISDLSVSEICDKLENNMNSKDLSEMDNKIENVMKENEDIESPTHIESSVLNKRQSLSSRLNKRNSKYSKLPKGKNNIDRLKRSNSKKNP